VPGIIETLPDLNWPVVEYQLKAKEEPREEIPPNEKFRAKEYPRDKTDKQKIDVRAIRTLDRDEVEKVCRRFEEVQRFTDEAVSLLDHYEPADMRAPVFGTAAEWLIAERIRRLGEPNFKAEVSYFKIVNNREARLGEARYGEKDTVRLDAQDGMPETKTVCVYEVRTGRRVWYLRRMDKLAENVQQNFPWAERLVLVQVKPTVSSYRRRR
jgi:hypothetical protein